MTKPDLYCTSTHDGEPCLQQPGVKVLPQQFVPVPDGTKALDAAVPVLWKSFIYISRYPLLPFQTPLDENTGL